MQHMIVFLQGKAVVRCCNGGRGERETGGYLLIDVEDGTSAFGPAQCFPENPFAEICKKY